MSYEFDIVIQTNSSCHKNSYPVPPRETCVNYDREWISNEMNLHKNHYLNKVRCKWLEWCQMNIIWKEYLTKYLRVWQILPVHPVAQVQLSGAEKIENISFRHSINLSKLYPCNSHCSNMNFCIQLKYDRKFICDIDESITYDLHISHQYMLVDMYNLMVQSNEELSFIKA
jgi:hypothetical protein